MLSSARTIRPRRFERTILKAARLTISPDSTPRSARATSGALPEIIQGGMGIGVSGWRLARAVSSAGQLGVVSGTSLDTLFVRRLQEGDPGGYLRRALASFPIPRAAADALRRHFRPAGLPAGAPYVTLPLAGQCMSRAREQLHVLAAFAEVHLAKLGHDGPVGINLLTKVQIPNLALLYGAMLAGVDFVLMGAGIPREIPAALDALALHRPAALRFEVEGAAEGDVSWLAFDPAAYWESARPELARPRFLPIVSSNSLASVLARKTGGVDGFVVEGFTAGGHNAPPRGGAGPDENGEPAYGSRDRVDLERLHALGLPFWVAGGAGWPHRLLEARGSGAAGIQVGTLFAYCDESGLEAGLKRAVLEHAARGEVQVRTEPRASPTGYPFKVVTWGEGDPAGRVRVCDLGYLRNAYARPDGRIGYRCASEPVEAYIAKGGRREDTEGRLCLCNGLLATVGHPQRRAGGAIEPPLLTSGDDLARIGSFLAGRTHYSATDVVNWLLGANAA